jgi:hypothetical protein
MKVKKQSSVEYEPEVPSLGWLQIYDARLETHHRLPITLLALKEGHLHLEASAVIEVAGTIRDDDVVTILDPEGKVVSRYWIGLSGAPLNLVPGESFTLLQRLGLGGPRGVIMGDLAQEG